MIIGTLSSEIKIKCSFSLFYFTIYYINNKVNVLVSMNTNGTLITHTNHTTSYITSVVYKYTNMCSN